MAEKKQSRNIIMGAMALALAAILIFSFMPKPLLVDVGLVRQGDFILTVDEEARTRVHDTYVVSTPVAGRLLRVEVEPGDQVTGGKTVLAQMQPVYASVLDQRTRTQARATVAAAEAALKSAQAQRNSAVANKSVADAEFDRQRQLFDKKIISQAAYDLAVRQRQLAIAALDDASAAIAMRKAELVRAKAQLLTFQEKPAASDQNQENRLLAPIPIAAPISGQVLRVMQQSETTLPAGVAILEIGNVANDLEVLVELLSTDAVKVKKGDKVMIDGWGGDTQLSGVVERVDPRGFTKFSALGVEEQRVEAVIRFTDPADVRRRLGHGFRVEVKIIIWEEENTIIVPASALFRHRGAWAVFVVVDGTAALRMVDISRNNGIDASVIKGLTKGEQVILYPASGLEDGSKIAPR